MEYTTLGRTGITVSVVGLGAGGPSRIGKSLGKSEADSIAVVRKAVDLGITFFDTAEGYATEDLIRQGLKGVTPDSVCISTKISTRIDGTLKTPEQFEQSLNDSLQRLGREWIDVYHLHAVMPDNYEETRDVLYPAMEKAKAAGKIRWTGITEMFGRDSGHEMLDEAVSDDLWDVIMVGFSAINFSARPLLDRTRDQGIGTLDMFAVRRALRDVETIGAKIEEFARDGHVDAAVAAKERPFAYAVESGACKTVPETSYRFCRHDPGTDVVLTGTSSVDHLVANVKAMEKPELPPEVKRRIEAVFTGVDTLSGN